MNIKIIASGSSGNAYTVSDGKTTLLIECGLPFKTLQKKSGFALSGIDACLISHAHADHAKSVCEVMNLGIDVYTSQGTINATGISGHRLKPIASMGKFSVGTINATGISGHRLKPIASMGKFSVGTFEIMPFGVEHDAPESLGFLICSQEAGEKLLYFTDTSYLKYTFPGLTHIMAESNYSIELLNKNAESDPQIAALKNRIIQNHMSIDTLCELLKANDLSKLQQIYLIHMSAGNADPEELKQRIQQLTGAEVYTAQKG